MESSDLRRVAIGALKTHEGDTWLGATVKCTWAQLGKCCCSVRIGCRITYTTRCHNKTVCTDLRHSLTHTVCARPAIAHRTTHESCNDGNYSICLPVVPGAPLLQQQHPNIPRSLSKVRRRMRVISNYLRAGPAQPVRAARRPG